VDDSELVAETVASRLEAAAREGHDLALRAGVVSEPAPAAGRLSVRVNQAWTVPGAPFVARASENGRLRIELELPGPATPATVAATRRSLASPAAQRAAALRHGFPGQLLLRVIAARNAGGARDLVLQRAVLEGWGLWALDWSTRVDWVENPLAADAELSTEVRRAQVFEAARLLASLEQHAEGLPEEEAAHAFRRRTQVDIDTARNEVRAAQHDPLLGIGFLGYLELRALEDRLAAASSRHEAIASLVTWIGTAPSVRPADLARRVVTQETR
jgi:hypothetical protein